MRIIIPYLLLLLLLLLLLFSVHLASAQNKSAYTKFKVVLDPGHGGKDSATKANGVYEKDVVLNIGLEIRNQLREQNIDVVMTRETDEFISLEDRAAIKGDLFISLHTNSVADSIGPSVRSMIKGIEIYVDGRMTDDQHFTKSKVSASILHKHLSLLEGIQPRSGIKQKPLAVLKNNGSPAILVELGFLTHSDDLTFLTTEASYRSMAKAFCKAILEIKELKK